MLKRFFVLFCVLTLSALTAFAQSLPTSTLTGKVSVDGAALPGVTVSVTSPNLQGTRTVVTTEAGDYILPLLPPGEYTVTYQLSGMQTVTRRITLTAARTDRFDVQMRPAALAEAITVTADTPLTAALESTQVSTNFNKDFFERLAVGRTITAVALLAPGVAPTGPSGNTMISGAMSFDSLYLVNGTIVNENLRGQPHNLFIEDAIQEMTVLTGGISAEYGHFTGGVVSAITKSGGNDFKGSFRTSFTNESWSEKTPFTVDQADDINEVYEGTLGGPFFRDRLWFFGAGRYHETSELAQTRPGNPRTGDQDVTPIAYPRGTEETRLEGKLTGSITPRHNLIASYIDVDPMEINNRFTSSIMDLASLNPKRETPITMLAVNYNGSLTDRLFVEAQYSEKEFGFYGGGARCYDLICGTLIEDRARGTRYNSPTFKYKSDGEQRNHDWLTFKGTYFLSTQGFGSHDIKVGYEDFMEVRKVDNYQSGSDFRISINSTIIRGTQIFPRMLGGSTSTQTRINWNPIFVLSQGSEYSTDSIFLNDRWTLNEHWSFNVGARYDKNDALSGDHTFKVADDSAISPRLAAHYDFRGDGRMIANLSFSQYVGRLAEGVGNDGDPAGRTASLQWYYRGPSINSNVNAPTDQLIPTAEAIRRVFEWFQQQGGTNTNPTRSVNIPGLDSILDPNGLKSPNVKEWTLGLGSAIGPRGYARADLIYRNWDDFYSDFTSQQTGKVTDQFGNKYDLTIVSNSDVLDREYTGVQTQFSWRPMSRLNVGGTYTWSRLVGNEFGENSGSGPITSGATSYPEYREARWNYPTGYLTADQRHRAKIWGSYDFDTPIGLFNLSLLQSFDSGNPTSVDGAIQIQQFVNNPGYVDPPDSVTYYFGGRGNLKSDDITRTDLALNYSTRLFGERVQLFVQPQITNLFNEDGIVSFDEEVLTADDEDYLKPFNPFTETPIECPQGATAATCQQMGAHFQKGQNFGKPDSEGDYQAPLTFRFSVGLRF